MTAVTPDIEMWLWSLPEEIRRSCKVELRIPRNDLIQLMAESHVLLAPSLVDGIPNILYEAFALGLVPIVSPLETFVDLFEDRKNVIYARNLYPQEIARALVDAITMPADEAQEMRLSNLRLVKKIADRNAIRDKVCQFYFNVIEKGG